MGRPPTKPKRFKDGFYIEVRNKGANAGMKIHFDTEHEMKEAAEMYTLNKKEVVILGEHKRDRWLNLEPEAEEKRVRKMKLDRDKLARHQEAKGFREIKAAKPAKPAKKEKPAKKVKPAKPAKKAKAAKPAKPVKVVKKAKPAAKAKAKKKK